MNEPEIWATFSIYDQQDAAVYKPAVLLFDKILMPIPKFPVAKLTQELRDEMEADALFLKRHGAAEIFDWDPNDFDQWQRDTSTSAGVETEALACALLKADPPMKTRLHLADAVKTKLPLGPDRPIAVPVYGSPARAMAVAEAATEGFDQLLADWTTFAVVVENMQIPDERVTLENLVRLRETKSFRDALAALRRWQAEKADQLVRSPDRVTFGSLEKEFAEYVRRFNAAVEGARGEKRRIALAWLFSVASAALMFNVHSVVAEVAGALAMTGQTIKTVDLRKPSWAAAEGRSFEMAGVVYHANHL
jgi:hypothetical protein